MKIRAQPGFTVVELVIIIVVIAILTTITVVSYRAGMGRLTEDTMKSDLQGTATAVNDHKNFNNGYPDTLPDSSKVQSDGNTVTYQKRELGYCIEVTSTGSSKRFYKTESGEGEGSCPVDPIIAMQTVTNASCTTSRVAAYDVRDEHTYWIQKMPDGKCWMLTNLAYTGGGVNTYSDIKTLENGTDDGAFSPSTPKFYGNTTNDTKRPNKPLTTASTGDQYGHLYNWCGAMGGQSAVCQENGTVNASVSICPAGWKIPSENEYTALMNALVAQNGGSAAGQLYTTWMGHLAGSWGHYGWLAEYDEQGIMAYLWSSTDYLGSVTQAMVLGFNSRTSGIDSNPTDAGFSVRCMAI